jgi:sulfite exporter TauE/SafE
MTAAAALIAGMATSLHCVGMCGPLACGVGTLAKSESERLAATSLYHVTRLASYGVIGAICGMMGRQPLQWFFGSPAVLLPWVMVGVLLALAFGLEKKLPRPQGFSRLMMRVRFRTRALPAVGGAAALGLLTPLLPCGPLYLVFGAALLAGSAAKGAEFTVAFGLGTVPLLWLAQQQFGRLRMKLSPVGMVRLRRGLALATALVLAWRLHDTLPFGSRTADDPATATELPACCH